MIWNQAHSVSLHRWCLCACVHCKIMNALTFPPPSRLQSTATVHTEATSAASHCWKTHKTVQHTWAPSFIDSQHQVRKEMLFHGEFSFCNKSKGNSVRCCGLTRRNSQTPQIRLHLRAREREHYYYDCKSKWMNGASSCPHITLPVLCLA